MPPFLFPVAKDFAWLFIDRHVSTETTGSQPPQELVSRWADQDLIGGRLDMLEIELTRQLDVEAHVAGVRRVKRQSKQQ